MELDPPNSKYFWLLFLSVFSLHCARETPTSTRPLMAQAAESRLVWIDTATCIYQPLRHAVVGGLAPRDTDQLEAASDSVVRDPRHSGSTVISESSTEAGAGCCACLGLSFS
jgi:hypothetical protein